MACILVVDDSRAIRTTISDHVRKAAPGAVVLEAEDADSAVALFALERPTVVFLDIVLPTRLASSSRITTDHRVLPGIDPMGGLAALAGILALDPRARVAVVTGLDDGHPAVVRARSMGAWRILPKPVDAGEVAAALARVPDDVTRGRADLPGGTASD